MELAHRQAAQQQTGRVARPDNRDGRGRLRSLSNTKELNDSILNDACCVFYCMFAHSHALPFGQGVPPRRCNDVWIERA